MIHRLTKGRRTRCSANNTLCQPGCIGTVSHTKLGINYFLAIALQVLCITSANITAVRNQNGKVILSESAGFLVFSGAPVLKTIGVKINSHTYTPVLIHRITTIKQL